MNDIAPQTIIRSGSASNGYWLDIWRHRELLLFLAWRDILVRYKQTVIGITWVVIRPVLTMLILTVVFGRVAGLPSGDAPYALLVFTGLLPWYFFSNALSECSNSLVANSHLLSKVYFPRLIVPSSTILVSAVDFIVSIAVLIILMLWYQIAPTTKLLAIPLLGIMVGLLSLGIGLLFSSLSVRYRDFRHLVPFMLQLGVYASPVGYSTSVISEKWAYIYYLNPIAGIIDGVRWAIIGTTPSLYGISISIIFIISMMTIGIIYFRSEEARFADDI